MEKTATIHDLCPAGDDVGTPALHRGSSCGPYRITRRLAVGGVGDVYEAVHTVLGRRAALKVLQLRHADRTELAERLAQEARVLSEIRHPNMVTVHDAGLLEGAAAEAALKGADSRDRGAGTAHPLMWMAMEYLEGRTLRETLWPDQRLPPLQALEYARQIASGVGAAHAAGAVHRDLKPENVMLCHDGRVVVLDLGTAKYLRATNLRATQRVMGTVAYMSPEHLTGEDVDYRSDVYSLGLVLWEMLVGYHPFSLGRSTAHLPHTMDLARRQIEDLPEPVHEAIPELSSFLWQVVSPALQKDPKDRYADMTVFANVLRQGIERLDAGGLAHPAAPVRSFTPRLELRRNPPVQGAAAVVPALPEVTGETEALPSEDPTRTLAQPAPSSPPAQKPAAPAAHDGAPASSRPRRPAVGRRPRGLSQAEIQAALQRAALAASPPRPRRRAPWYRHWSAAILCGVTTGALAFYVLIYRPHAAEVAATEQQAPTNSTENAPAKAEGDTAEAPTGSSELHAVPAAPP
jgi:serine/threonine-protein kinase